MINAELTKYKPRQSVAGVEMASCVHSVKGFVAV